MGILSLKSAILYSVSLYFHLHRTTIAKITLPSTKTPYFVDGRVIFAFLSTKTYDFMDRNRPCRICSVFAAYQYLCRKFTVKS